MGIAKLPRNRGRGGIHQVATKNSGSSTAVIQLPVKKKGPWRRDAAAAWPMAIVSLLRARFLSRHGNVIFLAPTLRVCECDACVSVTSLQVCCPFRPHNTFLLWATTTTSQLFFWVSSVSKYVYYNNQFHCSVSCFDVFFQFFVCLVWRGGDAITLSSSGSAIGYN